METLPTEPSWQSEFEVQAWLWSELRRLGLNVRGEVKLPLPAQAGAKKRAYCRFDLALFNGGRLAGIIEVKAHRTRHGSERGWLGTRQGMRYGLFGVPVCIVYGMDDAMALVERVRAGQELFQPQ